MQPPTEQSATTRFLPRPLKRLREHLREIRRLAGETHQLVSVAHPDTLAQLGALNARLTRLEELASSQSSRLEGLASDHRAADQQLALNARLTRLEELASSQSSRLEGLARLEELASSQSSRLEGLASDHQAAHQQLVQILRFVNDRGQWRRRQLRRLRSDPSYERAFTDPHPLISVVIATYDNYALLRERSIPSVLGQSYQNFEVVVIGDAAPEEARELVQGFDDSRISFFNLPYRGPYPDDPETRWLVAGVPACNEAVARARGLWIAPLADDDAFRSDHLERLLGHARANRLELAYGRLAIHFADADGITIGRFPPEHGQFGSQAALYHQGLREIFEYELADAAFELPLDWALCLRMMEASVRIGMIDEVTVDYYPSRSWTPRWEGDHYGPEPHQESQPDGRESSAPSTG